MQKEVSVSDLIVQFAVHDRNNREITENLQDTERMLNSPLLIPCNTEGKCSVHCAPIGYLLDSI